MRTYIGAPGWPELALNVASTCQILSVIVAVVCGCGCGVDNAAEDGLNKQLRDGGDGGVKIQQIEQLEQQTYCEKSDGVDSQLINVGVAHGCDGRIVVWLMRRSGLVVEPEKFRKEDF